MKKEDFEKYETTTGYVVIPIFKPIGVFKADFDISRAIYFEDGCEAFRYAEDMQQKSGEPYDWYYYWQVVHVRHIKGAKGEN